MAEAEAAILSWDLSPFAGQPGDQDGAERVAAGAVLTDDEIRTTTWLVDDVIGQLPGNRLRPAPMRPARTLRAARLRCLGAATQRGADDWKDKACPCMTSCSGPV
jgi:hypothetical protein